ncbi:MAG: ferritin-like domain-containing protein [Vicinamibacterales bacterium]
MPTLDSLGTLLEAELKDIYDAERQISKALPRIMKRATAPELREALQEHLQQTEQQIERLEEAFDQLELPHRGKKCLGMQNLLKEGDETMREVEDSATRDALIVAAAQKVEHYEIASYGTLRTWANLLGHEDVAALFSETLDEEKDTDRRLTAIAESFVNASAAEADDEDEEIEASSSSAPGRRGRAGGAAHVSRPVVADRGTQRKRTRGAASRSR